MSFRVDQDYVDIAGCRRKRGSKIVEQPRPVFSDDFDQRRRLAGVGIKMHAGRYDTLLMFGRFRSAPQKLLDIELPSAACLIFSFNRSTSSGLRSSVRFESANTNVSNISPLALANASAFTMSIPKLEIAPANEAKRDGLSRAMMVAR